jgi:hypothetical protein
MKLRPYKNHQRRLCRRQPRRCHIMAPRAERLHWKRRWEKHGRSRMEPASGRSPLRRRAALTPFCVSVSCTGVPPAPNDQQLKPITTGTSRLQMKMRACEPERDSAAPSFPDTSHIQGRRSPRACVQAGRRSEDKHRCRSGPSVRPSSDHHSCPVATKTEETSL